MNKHAILLNKLQPNWHAVLFVILVILCPQITYADNTQQQVFNLGIPYYDVDTGGGCAAGVGTANLTGNDNLQKAYNYFVSKGLTPAQSAGIVGNLLSESAGTMNPSIIQGGGKGSSPTPNVGFGIGQWTSPGRQQNLVSFAASENLPVNDLALQLDFIWHELSGDYKGSTLTPLQSASTAPEAAVIVMVNYEAPLDHSPTGPNARARSSNALGVLKLYGGSQPSSTAASPAADTSSSSGCSDGTATAGAGFIGDAPPGSLESDQCVAYVKWVLSQHFTPMNGKQVALGNGGQIAQALHDRYNVVLNNTPAVHSVVSWNPPITSTSNGHVAMVSQVNTDSSGHVTSIVVEEYNFLYENPGRYDSRTISNQNVISSGQYAHTEASWK